MNEYSITSDSSTRMNSQFSCANRLKFADLSNIYYALIAIALHLISILGAYKQIKVFMFTLMVDLSTQITERLENNDQATNLQNLDMLQENLSSSKFLITNQFATSITLLVFSIVSMFWFALFSLFKTGNLSNDNVQLGNDIITSEILKNQKIQAATTSDFSPKNDSAPLDFSLSSSSSPRSQTSRSSFFSSSASFFSTNSTETNQLKLKLKLLTLIRIFYLPPLNSCFHLLMCFFMFLVRLDLVKFQKTYDISRKSSNESQLINLTDYVSEYAIDLNHMNYIIALIALNFKLTRVYSNMNRLYALIIFIQLTLFTVIDLTTYSAFEALFVSQHTRESLSARIRQSDLKNILSVDMNSTFNHSSDDLLIGSETLLILEYSVSWLLNILYLSSFNLFGFSFFRQAHLKIRHKYEQYLTSFTTKNSNTKNNIQHSKPELQIEYSPMVSKIGVKNQYKAILIGIVSLLLIEASRVPLIYSFYTKYFHTNSREIYLVALILHLVYLVFNAFFWILLSFKTDWTVRFSADFRALFWNRLFTEYFHTQDSKKIVSASMKDHKAPGYKVPRKRSRSAEGNFVSRIQLLPKPLKKASKLFVKNRNNCEYTRNTNVIDGYFLTEISRLPSYHTKSSRAQHDLPSYDRKFVDYSIESLLKAHNQSHLKKLYFNEPRNLTSTGIYIPQPQGQQMHHDQNFYDNHLSDNNSDLNAEITSDEFEIKVKLENAPKRQGSCIMSSFNKNSSFSEFTENTMDSGREFLPVNRNEQFFDRRKLFSTILNEKNKILEERLHRLKTINI